MQTNVEKLRAWLRTDLPCVAGKREFAGNRYFIAEIDDAASMTRAYDRFLAALEARETVAGLFVLSEQIALPPEATARDQFLQCATLMRGVSDLSPEALADGGRLGKSVSLRCPVTEARILYDDFDAVAFCPQSFDRSDALYDPMMGSPVPCINFSSDIYAFAMFACDVAQRLYEKPVRELSCNERAKVFAQSSAQWQRFALVTIRKYMAITDLARCPISLASGDAIWFANHQDPAFAETQKCQYGHHMPVLYTPRIVETWEAYFEDGLARSMPVQAITPFGHAIGGRPWEARS